MGRLWAIHKRLVLAENTAGPWIAHGPLAGLLCWSMGHP